MRLPSSLLAIVALVTVVDPLSAQQGVPPRLTRCPMKLSSLDEAAGDLFGRRGKAVNDSITILGAPGDDDNGPESGSAYVFIRANEVWTQEAKLLPDGRGGGFGTSVSVRGDTTVIGAIADPSSGSAYVFVRTDGVWTQQAKLLADDGAAFDRFDRHRSVAHVDRIRAPPPYPA